jgi:hypothetical protein
MSTDEYFRALRDVVQDVKDANTDPSREDRVVRDEEGLVHYSVASTRGTEAPYVVAMCEVFDEIDAVVVAEDLGKFGMPKRRWPLDQETEGVVSCLRCLGI